MNQTLTQIQEETKDLVEEFMSSTDQEMYKDEFLRDLYAVNLRVLEKVKEMVENLPETTGCVGVFMPTSPTEAKGWCCPRHYGQNDIKSILSTLIEQK